MLGQAVRCMYDFAPISHLHAERPEGEAWSWKTNYFTFPFLKFFNYPTLLFLNHYYAYFFLGIHFYVLLWWLNWIGYTILTFNILFYLVLARFMRCSFAWSVTGLFLILLSFTYFSVLARFVRCNFRTKRDRIVFKSYAHIPTTIISLNT